MEAEAGMGTGMADTDMRMEATMTMRRTTIKTIVVVRTGMRAASAGASL